MHPELSVIIPAYNAELFLAEAVASVRNQTAAISKEILIYNDGSTDNTASVIASLGADIIALGGEGTSAGPAVGRNAGLSHAQGRLVAFLDADDLWLPDKLEKQLQVLERAEKPTVVFGEIQEFDAGGPRGDYQPSALTSACLIERSLAHSVGPLEATLMIGDFADWLARLQAAGAEFDYSAGPVSRRRHHDNNLGRRMVQNRKDYLEVIRRKLARDRQREGNATR